MRYVRVLGTYSTQVYGALRKALDLRKFSIESVYNGSSFRIIGRGNYTNIYIRLENRNNINCVNFSSISIDEKLQRTGILTTLVNEVSKQPAVGAIIIGSVCTEEMRNWCKKNRYDQIGYGTDFIKIIHSK